MTKQTPPIWKQLLGAVIGGSLALALYGIYTVSEPHLQGLLVLPQAEEGAQSPGVARVASKDISGRRLETIARRAQNIAAEFSDRQPNWPESDGTEYDTRLPEIDEEVHMGADLVRYEDDFFEPIETSEPVYSYDPAPTPPPQVAPSHHVQAAPVLPNSGVGIGAAMLMSMLGASGAVYRKRKGA